MDANSFVYWLNGYLELAGKDATFTSEQVEIVRAHLRLVLRNVTADEDKLPDDAAKVDPTVKIEDVRKAMEDLNLIPGGAKNWHGGSGRRYC